MSLPLRCSVSVGLDRVATITIDCRGLSEDSLDSSIQGLNQNLFPDHETKRSSFALQSGGHLSYTNFEL